MRHKWSGFSLIEVMMSFVLIGVAALAMVKLQVVIQQQADFALNQVQALHLAEQKLEWFRTRGSVSGFPTTPAADFDVDLVSGTDRSHPFYTVNWVIPAATVSGTLKTITVEVSWRDRRGKTQSVQLETMVSRLSEK